MLSSKPVEARISGICPHCLEFRDAVHGLPEECSPFFPISYVVPYDHPWRWDEEVIAGVGANPGARLMGKFMGRDPERLAIFGHLQSLYLSRYPLPSPDSLRELAGLRSLHLDYMPIAAAEAVDALPCLASLMLTQCRGPFDLNRLKVAQQLRLLRVTMCPGVSDLTALAACSSLARIDIEARELSSLLPLAKLERLEVLNLAVGRVRDGSAEVLKELPRLRKLGLRRTLAKRSGVAASRPDVKVELFP